MIYIRYINFITIIQILYEISDAYHDYKKKDNIQDQDLRELLQLSMEMGEYDIAKSISKTSYRRMANKYKDVAFHVALAMECTGTKDDQLYALEVYDNLLNTHRQFYKFCGNPFFTGLLFSLF